MNKLTTKHFVVVLFIAAIFSFRPHASSAATTCSVLLRPATVTVRDGHGKLLSGIRVNWYREGRDADGQPFLNGRAVATGATTASGQWTGCVPKSGDPLALNLHVFNAALAHQVYWSSATTATESSVTADVQFGTLAIILRNAEGTALRNVNFDLYAEQRDANGQLIFSAANLVAKRQSTGSAANSTLPVGAGTFVLRIASSIANQPIIRDQQIVNPGQAATADHRLETMRLIVLDGIGRAQPKFKFALYAQGPNGQQTLVGKPLLTSATETNGRKDLLLPAGTYNVVASGTLATVFRRWNQVVTSGQLTTITLRLSGLRILHRDSVGRPDIGTRFSIYTQRLNDRGNPVIDRRILHNRALGKEGYRDLLLPPGTYIVRVNEREYTNIDIAAEHFSRLDVPRTLTLRVSDEASLTTPLQNNGVTYRPVATPAGLGQQKSLRVTLGGSYALKAKKISRGITAVFYISRARLQAENIDPKKLRILFRNESTQRWSYLGRYDRTRNQVVGTLRQPGVAMLVVIR